jgi:L-cystine uptake protein TcyP (sodium:dicarboxylate symporter family)
MTINVILNLLAALALLGLLYAQQRKHASFSVRVFTGMGLGVVLGAAVQAIYGAGAAEVKTTGDYLDIVGSGYVKLLQMIVMPLIMVSIISAILKLKGINSLGKISALTIGTLMVTTLIAASIGIVMAKAFSLSAVGLTASAADIARGVYLQGKVEAAQAISLPSMLLSFIPANPFLDMTGGCKTSTIAVVIFSVFIGIAATGIHDKKPDIFASFERFVQVAHAIVMRIVTLVLRLTPYGVFALMAQVVSSSSYTDILHLIDFVLASYSALLLMFGCTC